MTNAVAFAIGSVCGYFAYISAIAAQDVCTTCVSSCSIHTQASHVYSICSSTSKLMYRVTYLVALAPTTVCPLLAHEKVACSTSRLACFVCLAHERKALQSEHRGIGKADTPGPHPAAFGQLNRVQICYSTLYCFAVANHNGVSTPTRMR